MKKRVINATGGRIPVGGVTIAPGGSAEVEVSGAEPGEGEARDEAQELLAGGALVLDNKENRRRLGLDEEADS